MRDTIIDLLNDINSDYDYEVETALIDDKILTSFEALNLMMQIEDEFNIQIPPKALSPENFNSVDAIVNMIEELKK